MEQKIRELKGIGEKTEKLFQKLGIYTTEDLVQYYPRSYETYSEPEKINTLKPDKVYAILGTVCTSLKTSPARNKTILTTTLSDETGKITAIWYNMPFLRNSVKARQVFVFRGKVVEKNGRRYLEHPEIFMPAAYRDLQLHMQPVYALTAGLSNKTILKYINQKLESGQVYRDYIPDEIKKQFQLADYNYALQTIHFPKTMEELLVARKRLVFDEFFWFLFSVQMLKEKNEEAKNTFPMKKTWTTEAIIENLPYTLTNCQKKVWHEIEENLGSFSLMSRLVQGDVGSGKTIIAFLTMIMTADHGYQAAMMAPTEVLAKQHYMALCRLIEEQGLNELCHPVLLTGSNTAKEKREIYRKIKEKEANLIIGTHALIQEKVEYDSLALVITDEQHRFGVQQREALANKGNLPHILVMSATPIPRTLAIILYGDLSISVLDELPAKRLPIKNCVVDISYRPKAYQFMEQQIREGRQVYIICPMVEESEGADGENVIDYTKRLQEIFPSDITITFLHGKMKPKEKNEVMEAFARKEIQILVSTTVIEVGVDVPNATVMMIENAERFGLAQLHQLRGRVGRGSYQSYCIFMQGNQETEISKRLKILNQSNDGFYIASEDLKLRGPGDLFGIRQSGNLEFRIGDIYNDVEILKMASDAVSQILTLDPLLTLPQNSFLQEKLKEYINKNIENLSL